MKKSSFNRIALVACATLAMTAADRAVAESTDSKRLEDLEKENVTMRARLRRLEAESENASLRAKIERLETRRSGATHETGAPPAPPRTEASAPQRTLILADMLVKAPPAIAPRLYSWTGFYVGANIGYGLGDNPVSSTILVNGFTTFGDPSNTAPAGAIGGAQLGYNWQGGSNWLVGFEADFQASAQKGVTCIINCVHSAALGFEQTLTSGHKIDYFGTVRGRIGWVYNHAVFYATGGGAYGRVEHTDATFVVLPPIAGGGAGRASGVSRQNKFGYVVGGGAEATLGGNWTGKIEYLYMDLGTIGASSNTFINSAIPTSFTLATDSRIRDHIFRIGVNYRVNGDPAPVSAYASMAAAIPGPGAPVYSWTGFYAGANVGGIIGNDRISQTVEVAGLGTVTTDPTNIVPKGVLGGVQVGYNFQAGPRWLVGFEADFQGSNQSARSCTPDSCFRQTSPVGADRNAFVPIEQTLDYFGTIRGRVGAVNDNVLYYVTGGAAFGHFNQTVSADFTGSPILKAGTTSDLIGYAVGGGIEAAIWGGWTTKVEYLFMNFGTLTTVLDAGAFNGTIHTTSTIRDHVVRVGTNYRF
jgi:outer membrane immunogenic protein